MSAIATRPIRRIAESLVVIAAIATIPLIITQEHGNTSAWIAIADWTIWTLFAIDFAIALYFA